MRTCFLNLTPSGGPDTTAPSVTVTTPNGGESINAHTYYFIGYSATDDGAYPRSASTCPTTAPPTSSDEGNPNMDIRDLVPVERTYSEWSVSEYASSGVYAPQFAGYKPDGAVSNCQDCHNRRGPVRLRPLSFCLD